jgi:hypothetical protein
VQNANGKYAVWITKIIIVLFRKQLGKTKLTELVAELLARFFSVLLYVAVILLAVGALGFSMNSVVLGLSAVIGIILGFGMQDSITNLASGVWIAALRPIDKDEVVEGKTGKVTAVGLMATEILSYDNKFITIPNKLVWGSPIVNHTRMPTRRVDVAVGISYESDLKKAIQNQFSCSTNSAFSAVNKMWQCQGTSVSVLDHPLRIYPNPVSLCQVINHPLLDRFVYLHKIRDEVIHQMFLIHFAQGANSLSCLSEIIRYANLAPSHFPLYLIYTRCTSRSLHEHTTS